MTCSQSEDWLQVTLAEFKGPTSKGRDGRGWGGREGREGMEREGEGPLVLAYTPDVKSWIKPCRSLKVA